jgi:hypothetical protein
VGVWVSRWQCLDLQDAVLMNLRLTMALTLKGGMMFFIALCYSSGEKWSMYGLIVWSLAGILSSILIPRMVTILPVGPPVSEKKKRSVVLTL